MLHLPRKAVSANDKDLSFQKIAVPKVLSEEVREVISNNVLQFYVRDQQQEAQDEGITALYERLSQEDKLEGESNSIANQKRFWKGTAGSMELPLIGIMTRTTDIPAQTSTAPVFSVCLPI